MNDTISFGQMLYQLKGQQNYKNISPNKFDKHIG